MPDYSQILNPKHPDYGKPPRPKGVAPSEKLWRDYMASMYPEAYWKDPAKGIPRDIYSQRDVPTALKMGVGDFYGFHHPMTDKIYINEEFLLPGSVDYQSAVVHEMAHSQQMKKKGLIDRLKVYLGVGEDRGPYNKQPSEIQAYNDESDYRAKFGLGPRLIPNVNIEDWTGSGEQDWVYPPLNYSKPISQKPERFW